MAARAVLVRRLPVGRLLVGLLLAGLLLAGCDGASTASSATASTPVARPAVPQGWITLSSDDGEVHVTVPPDFKPLFTGSGVVAQPPVDLGDGGVTSLEIWANGPGSVLPQPAGNEPLRNWIEQSGWLPREGEGGVTAIGDRSERELVLPAGRALEVALTVQPGTPEASRAVVYFIVTARGIAVVRFIGFPAERIAERAHDLELVARLVAFD